MEQRLIFKVFISAFLLVVTSFLSGNGSLFAQTATELKVNTTPDIIKEVAPPKQAKSSKRDTADKAESSQKKESKKDTPTDSTAVKTTLIHLENTDVMTFDNEKLPDIQVLTGNVILRHDEAYLYCDSAHMNRIDNSFDAYGNVRIEQGDSIFVYARKMRYDGNTRIAKLHEQVRMINGEVTLTTDVLTYDRNHNVGYYLSGGTLQDSLNTLVSQKGYYHTDSKLAEFKKDVVGTNANNVMKSDTLLYHTDSKIATILGPTSIINADSSVIYSEYGWYNTSNDKSKLEKNSVITYKDGKTLEGDTIYYDKVAGLGEVFDNVCVTDTTNSIILTGNYGYYREQNEVTLLTDSVRMMEFSRGDTIYIHGDSLYSHSSGINEKMVNLYYNVRLFSDDFQGVCDSLRYFTGDSVLHLMQQPVIWSTDQQITGDTIFIFPADSVDFKVRVVNNSMIAQQVDTVHYNQMSGKEIVGYIVNNKLNFLEILGNAESIFFPTDDGELIGLNKIASSYMNVYFEDGKLNRLNVFPSPKANMYPMNQIQEVMLHLQNFTWQDDTRPISKDDIFRHPERMSKEDLDAKKMELQEMQKEERRQKRQRDKANSENTTAL